MLYRMSVQCYQIAPHVLDKGCRNHHAIVKKSESLVVVSHAMENSETESRLFWNLFQITNELNEDKHKKVNMMKLHTLLEFVLLPPE